MVELHHVIRLFHTDLLIKRNRVFISYKIYSDILLTAGKFMRYVLLAYGISLAL